MKIRKPFKRGKPPKKVKNGTLKNKLDAAFSAMIRERDDTDPCISCKKNSVSQSGHFMRRELLATRWHPENSNGQCAHCNCWLHGNLLEYADNLDKKYGSGTSQKLRDLARTSWKPGREALENLLEAARLGAESYAEIWKFYGSETA